MNLPIWALPLLALGAYLIGSWLLSMLGWVLVIAAGLWAIAAFGLLHKVGRLASLAGGPVGAVLDLLINRRAAPAGSMLPSQTRPATTSAPAPKVPPPDRKTMGASAVRRIDALHGISRAKRRMSDLLAAAVTARKKNRTGFGMEAPAVLIAFHGPAGTGKTEAAEAFAEILYGDGIIKEPNLVVLRSGDAADAGAGGANQLLRQAAEAALDGVLIIEDAEWLAGPRGSDSEFAKEAGRGLMHVARSNPHRLIILATGGPGMRRTVLENPVLQRELFGRLHVNEVAFDELEVPDLVAVFEDGLRRTHARLDEPLRRRLPDMINNLRRAAGDQFDNAIAVRRWFDIAYGRAQVRAAAQDTPVVELLSEDFEADQD